MEKKSKFKIQRRLGVELPGFGDKKAKGPLSKRPYAPGMHGQQYRRKVSEYGKRLMEKQKLRYHYGLKESQLLRFIKNAKRKSNNWFEELSAMLECRLDNLVFRLGFAPTMASARQMVSHGNVLVDGKKCDIASRIVKKGSVISLKPKVYENKLFIQTLASPTLELPSFLSLSKVNDKQVGELIEKPTHKHIPFQLEEQLIIEFYGKIK